jgi:glutamate dehydrogenase (NAD(P)+)
VQIQKLTATDGFIVFDLDGAPAAGITRAAPKILVDGATALARTSTYRFASFERQVGGASAGINAKPEDRSVAVAAYVEEVSPLVGAGRFLTEAGRGVEAEALAALRALDPRPGDYWDLAEALTGVGVAAAAAVAAGGLEGRTVALEGFDSAGPAIAAGLGRQGARIVAVSTAEGTAVGTGFDPDALADLWPAHGPKLVAELAGAGPPATDPAAVFGVDADVVVTGSRSGVITDELADRVAARVVVPSGPTPVTAKALARLRRAGKVVVPDFVSTAGPLFAGWPAPGPGGADDPTRVAAEAIRAVMVDVIDHPDGPLLAACYRAEAYLATWCEQLPFGRPIA